MEPWAPPLPLPGGAGALLGSWHLAGFFSAQSLACSVVAQKPQREPIARWVWQHSPVQIKVLAVMPSVIWPRSGGAFSFGSHERMRAPRLRTPQGKNPGAGLDPLTATGHGVVRGGRSPP
jgi:hypothetical protein